MIPLKIIHPQVSREELAEVQHYKRLLKKAAQNAPLLPNEPRDRAIAMRQALSKAPFISKPHPQGQTRTIDSSASSVKIRVLLPPTIKAVYLDIHGGGWAIGSATMGERLNWQLAETAGVAVVSVDYRLAPEYPYPAAPDDCEAVAVWLLETAKGEFGTERLLIGGESAGAHLAVATLLRVRDRYQALDRFEAANLFYGIYDLGGTPSCRLGGCEASGDLTPARMTWYTDLFLPNVPTEARRDRAYSPLYADLAGMPPALLTVSHSDILLDDSLFLASRWAAAGSPAELAIYPELPHGFTLLPLSLARKAYARSLEFICCVVNRI